MSYFELHERSFLVTKCFGLSRNHPFVISSGPMWRFKSLSELCVRLKSDWRRRASAWVARGLKRSNEVFHPSKAAWMLPCLASGFSGFAAEMEAEQAAAEKWGFNLFRPTPARLLRELSADRPDKTDSPYTVDAGHFQLEMDVANYSRSAREGVLTERYQAAPMNLKAGVLNRLDLQLVIEPFIAERIENRSTGVVMHRSGMGDVTPRFKVNFWGNDTGSTALALLPFVKLPANQNGVGNNSVEGGVKLPFAVKVPGWDVALMSEYDLNRDQAGQGHHLEIANSVSVGHKVYKRLSLYGEFYGRVSMEQDAGWIGTVDTWLTWQLTPNLRLDGGAYIGVTRAANDLQPFMGLTWRF